MTVDARLQLTPGEYLIHPDGSASKVVDKRNLTVDEVLATGEYIDRRGRMWEPDDHWLDYWSTYGGPHAVSRTHMRLLIERDMHEDECPGLYACLNHPVPKVLAYAGPEFTASKARSLVELRHDTLPAAMDAARSLAVASD